MNLTSRLKRILIVLLEEDQAVAVKTLAERLGVSKRTVQRELEYIGDDLKDYGVSFEAKTGKGVWLSGSEEAKQALWNALNDTEDYDVSNRVERRKRLILEILKEKGLKKLFYYANQFQVSEATISTDLEAIEGWLNGQHLEIKRKPGYGVIVEGTEKDYRRAIRTFIEENIDTQILKEAYEVGDWDREANRSEQYTFGKMLNEDVLKRVVKCISSMENKRMLSMTENSYMGLILHIFIAITRILKNEIIEEPKQWQEQLEKDEDYLLAEEIVDKLSKEFEIEIPAMEVVYVCLHIKGAKHQNIEWNGEKTVALERKELLELINKMILAYDEPLSYALKQDGEFIQGLLAHLQPTFIRLVYDMTISNPILEEIKNTYPEVYEKSQRAAAVLSEWIRKEVPAEEVGFLTIHFGAAQVRLEGQKENIRQVSVGIVCASGIGISRLMLSKLDKIFKDRIRMEAYGKNDLTPYVMSKTDFFVSSLMMQQEEADMLFVNPLLSEKDIEAIRQKVYYYERLPKEKEEPLFTLQLEQINHVAMEIKNILRQFELIEVDPNLTFGQLIGDIAERLSPYKECQEMIQKALEDRERLGSQIFAELGFALLHTRTKGITRPVFGVWAPKGTDRFQEAYFQEINRALVMLIPEDDQAKSNSEIFSYISSSLIDDYDFLDTLLQGSEETIRGALSQKLKQFFYHYLNKLQKK